MAVSPELGAARRCEHSSPEGGAGEHGALRSGPEASSGGAELRRRRRKVFFFFVRRSSATLVATKKMPPASNIVDGETSRSRVRSRSDSWRSESFRAAVLIKNFILTPFFFFGLNILLTGEILTRNVAGK